MTQLTTLPTADAAVAAIQDRLDITDVLYRYASTIDEFDHDGLRAILDRRHRRAVRQCRAACRRRRGRRVDR